MVLRVDTPGAADAVIATVDAVGIPAARGQAAPTRTIALSVVIPMFNESHRLASTIATLARSELSRLDVEIVFVDDGSTDASADVAQRAIDEVELRSARVLRLPANLGKGGAVRSGVATTTGACVVFLDADLSLEPDDVRANFERLRASGDDAVLGVRVVDHDHQPLFRAIASKVFRRLASVIVATSATDPQCAMKIIRGSLARELFAQVQTNGFSFDVELLARLHRCGAKVTEVPIHWEPQPGSKVRPIADSVLMARELVRIRSLLGG